MTDYADQHGETSLTTSHSERKEEWEVERSWGEGRLKASGLAQHLSSSWLPQDAMGSERNKPPDLLPLQTH